MKAQKDYRLLKQFISYSHEVPLEFWIVMGMFIFGPQIAPIVLVLNDYIVSNFCYHILHL